MPRLPLTVHLRVPVMVSSASWRLQVDFSKNLSDVVAEDRLPLVPTRIKPGKMA